MRNFLGYTVITIYYPTKKMMYLGFCSTARGLGCMLGPVVGQMIYSITNYDFGLTFFIFAALITPFMLLAVFILPNSLNQRQYGPVARVQ
jgi:MFS family permease